ncbi:MAG: CPBP family intramembrane metalloprotease, partial [Candidatus Lokiarchaeota archaeon]|nr:CPBP family intramembrane metalloprotease [Candidatus Lokiarchaeota archaeon]
NRREMATKRFKFLFYEVVPIFLLLFTILSLEWVLLQLIVNPASALFGMLFYLIRALAIFLGIILFLFISNRYRLKKIQHANKELALHKGFLKLYKMTKKNYFYQFLYSLLLFFLILTPLEFLISFTLPQTVSYRAVSLVFKYENSYLLLDNFLLFLFSSCVIQFSISFSEETVFRGLITKRGSEHFNKISAVMISTISFMFFEVLLFPLFFTDSYYFRVIWFIKSFIIGLVLSLTMIRRKWLFPSIFAKTINSVISIVIIWEFLQGGNIIQSLIFIYSPLLIISLILLLLQRSRVKESLQIGMKMMKAYFRNDIKAKESSADKTFRILFDIFVAFLLFLIALLITV